MSDTKASETVDEHSDYDKDYDVAVYRTDVSNPEKWEELKKIIIFNESPPPYYYIDAPDIPLEVLPLLTEQTTYIILADDVTMNENKFLVIERETGNKVRVQAEYLADVANNLWITDMDFFEIEEAVKEDGVFRGFD